MIFTFMIPEETYKPQKRVKSPKFDEAGYFLTDRDKLSAFKCPICGEYELFRGCVFIGCSGCMNYFNEKEIIEANIEG